MTPDITKLSIFRSEWAAFINNPAVCHTRSSLVQSYLSQPLSETVCPPMQLQQKEIISAIELSFLLEHLFFDGINTSQTLFNPANEEFFAILIKYVPRKSAIDYLQIIKPQIEITDTSKIESLLCISMLLEDCLATESTP